MLSLIFYLSTFSSAQLPELPINFANIDKLEHACIYSLLGFALCRALTHRNRTDTSFHYHRKAIIWTIVLGMFYGISDEIHQYFVPGRDSEVGDVIADTVGSGIGAFAAYYYRVWMAKYCQRSPTAS